MPSHPFGSLQRLLLEALRRHGREASLQTLAMFAGAIIPDLGTRPPGGRAPSRARYVAVARAVAALRRRGLVQVERVGVVRGRIEWLPARGGRLQAKWHFLNPTTWIRVRAVELDDEKGK
jgi:hypothetical protein